MKICHARNSLHKHKGQVHLCEFTSGTVFRSVHPPKKIDADKFGAEFKRTQFESSKKENELRPMEKSEWYALHVRPRFERVGAFHLKKQNIEHYLPLRRVTRQSSMRSIELPLLPGYLFCQVQTSQSRSLWMIPGVLNVLGVPADRAILNRQVRDLKRIVDSGFPVRQCPFRPTGRMVKVQNGALQGISGILNSEPPHLRVLVLSIDLIQRSVGVRLGKDYTFSSGDATGTAA